ncbi:MAG: caspase family protein [Myxococcota bacterium]
MRLHRCVSLLLILGACDCGEDGETPTTPPTGGTTGTPSAAGPALFEADGALAVAAGTSSQEFDVPITSGVAFEVQLTSSSFDPVLAVQAPGMAVLTNDDWQGSRSESRIRGAATTDGVLKITVTSFDAAASGAFHVAVIPAVAGAAQVPATQLSVGQNVEGALEESDTHLADGRLIDHYVIQGQPGSSLELNIEALTPTIPNAILMSPSGQSIGTAENGRYAITQPGPHRLQLVSAAPGQQAGYRIALSQATGSVVPTLARSHHTWPSDLNGPAIRLGETVRGQLDSSRALPTGEPALVYSVDAQEGQPLVVEMRSTAFDPYLMMLSPSGQHWENDDHDGTRDAGLDVVAPESGTYRIVATAYRAQMAGVFELKASGERRVVAAAQATAAGASETRAGALAAGDSTLPTGEFADAYTFDLAQGERVYFGARSSAFDTYLIVAPPSGDQTDNDDESPPNTDAGIDYVASVAGTHRVTVTSYQPGETGAYTLEVRRSGGAAAPPAEGSGGTPSPSVAAQATGERTSGTLAAGDRTLDSGEFADAYTRTFAAGQSVQVRLESSQFDPYLIMTPPGGTQQDNDDLDSTTRTAGFDIPAAQAGEYRFIVTSYQPGETGAYSLSFGAGAAAPQAGPTNPTNPTAPPAAGAPRVFGLFAGISDYPAGVGDLPECANDAVKLAEALRNQGLLTEDRQVLLTDAQATQANMLQGLQLLASQMQPTDVFVFFFSGHGGQGRPGSQDTREIDGVDEFLVMHDGQLLDDRLATAFDAVGAGTSLIAIDSCHSGGFAKDLITRPGRVGLFSSEEDVLSAVAGQFQAGGYLSHFLRTGVMGEADTSPQDRVLTVGELARFLRLQFSAHASDVQFQGAYQHIVVDRGAVSSNQVLWRY